MRLGRGQPFGAMFCTNSHKHQRWLRRINVNTLRGAPAGTKPGCPRARWRCVERCIIVRSLGTHVLVTNLRKQHP
jgi:hypothetical protein